MARRKNLVVAGVSVVAVFALAGSFYAALSVAAELGARVSGPADRESAETTSPIEVSPTQPLGTIIELSVGVASTLSKSATPIPREELGVGDCVDVAALEIRKASCGSGNSHYKVAESVPAGGQCPGDVDRAQPRTLPGGEHETLCLDIDWNVGGCVDLSGNSVAHVDCAADVPGRVRVLEILPDTTDVNVCSSGDRGVVYGERRYVVCVSSR
ncbi:LppU/SCO3897 family protein [Nocardia sp. SSK8]|uniref:LppU/SCO3897 family protein n=1 Tax=Nocardia sp. SSK8 TaxID=3120154 RepID=UPI00300B3C5E